jgi:hypothetical protein
MNKHYKVKAIKKINRVMGNRACQFFLFGNPSCKESFRYRLNQFTNGNYSSVDIDDWYLKEQQFNLKSEI